MYLISSPNMTFDIDAKIQELKDELESIKKRSDENQRGSGWWYLLKEWYFGGELSQLEAIRNKTFHVAIDLNIHCETFGTKEFPILEFDLTDDYTVQCAIKSYERYKNEKKDPSSA